MLTTRKITLQQVGQQTINLPPGYVCLYLGMQGTDLEMHVMGDITAPRHVHDIRIRATGQDLPDFRTHLGSFVANGTVYHVLDVTPFPPPLETT